MYGLDLTKLIQWLLPAPIRKVAMIAWLSALIAPIKILHGQFLLFRSATLEDLRVTGQVRILRYWLNQKFDPQLQGVTITQVASSDQVFIFLESENQPVYLPIFISGQAVHFTVTFPNNEKCIDAQVRAFLNRHKLPTRNYQIVYGIAIT